MKASYKSALLVLVVLLILPIVYFFVCDIYLKGTLNDKKVNYLKANSVEIDLESFSIPDGFLPLPEANTFNVYILGEFHGFSPTHLFDAAFFEYLNKHYKVRDYCSEFFIQDAAALNLLLSKENLDTDLLYRIIADIAQDNLPQLNTEEYFHEWTYLYNYNKTLPDSAKIRVHGLLGDKRTFGGNRDSEMAANLIRLKNNRQLLQRVYCLTG